MRKIEKLFLLTLLATGFSATAADSQRSREPGNGGDVVVCNEGKADEHVEFYDRYEARVLYGMNFDFGGADKTFSEKVDLGLRHLSKVMPIQANTYRMRTKKVMSQIQFLTGVDLVDRPGQNRIATRKGCNLRQVVAYRPTRIGTEKKYLANQKLWDKLSLDDKVLAAFHLVLLEDYQVPSSDDSSESHFYPEEKVRYANLLFLTGLKKENQFIFLKEILRPGYPRGRRSLDSPPAFIMEFEGVQLADFTDETYSFEGTVGVPSNFKIGPNTFSLPRSSRLVFTTEGYVSSVSYYPRIQDCSIYWDVYVGGQKARLCAHRITFYPDGAIGSGNTDGQTKLTLPNGRVIQPHRNYDIVFYRSGVPQYWHNQDGSFEKYPEK